MAVAQRSRKKKKNKVGIFTAIVLTLFCMTLLGFGVWLFYLGASGGSSDTIARPFQVEGLDPSAITGSMPGTSNFEKLSGENQFGYRIQTNLTIPANGKNVQLEIENPAFNDYLLVLEICSIQSPVVLYRSQYIAPNQYIPKADFSNIPASGRQDGTAYLNLIDPQTMKLAGILECPLTLNVENVT